MINYSPLTIGEFVSKLEKQPQGNDIWFDFGDCIPTTFDSYRGFYDQLALGFDIGTPSITVAGLLELAKKAQYGNFTGYKGGSYKMSPDASLWASNYGSASSTAIIDVVTFEGCDTRIVTVYIP